MPEEFTSIKEVHDEIELVVSLEGKVQVNDERVLDLLENFSLSYRGGMCSDAYLPFVLIRRFLEEI